MNTISHSVKEPEHLWRPCPKCGRYAQYSFSDRNKIGLCKSCGFSLPAVNLSGAPGIESPFEENILERNLKSVTGKFIFLCPKCRAKFELSRSSDNQVFQCNKCWLFFVVRSYLEKEIPQTTRPLLLPTATAQEEVCSACHSPIAKHDNRHECPSCKIPFHAGCWQENLGCSAYGCPMVQCLKTGPDLAITGHELVSVVPPPNSSLANSYQAPVPSGSSPLFGKGLLAATIVAGFVSLFTYGIPSFVTGVLGLALLCESPHYRDKYWIWLALTIFISTFFLFVGVRFSSE